MVDFDFEIDDGVFFIFYWATLGPSLLNILQSVTIGSVIVRTINSWYIKIRLHRCSFFVGAS